MRNNMFRKGVSPLIAAVLLIAFTVALGAIIMTWGRGFVTSQTDSVNSESAQTISCSLNVDLDWVLIEDEYQVCFDTDSRQLALTVQNTGSEAVTKIKTQVVLVDGRTFNIENETAINMGDAVAFRMNITAGAPSDVRHVSVSPYIDVPGQTAHRLCSNTQITLSDVRSSTTCI